MELFWEVFMECFLELFREKNLERYFSIIPLTSPICSKPVTDNKKAAPKGGAVIFGLGRGQ